MRRPCLPHFLAIDCGDFINIKATVIIGTLRNLAKYDNLYPNSMSWNRFKIKIIGISKTQDVLYQQVFESDHLGGFDIRIENLNEQKIYALKLYELNTMPNVELRLGTYVPLQIKKPKKLIICDFDKTLLDTRYSTLKEFYTYLTKPLDHFTALQSSINILQEYVKDGFHPFIISASPHFYRSAIRDWLYQHKIYSTAIFLRDYRQIFNTLESALTLKDLRRKGIYKIHHIVDLLLMSDIPDELVMIEDNFDADPTIYSAVSLFLQENISPQEFHHLLQGFSDFETTHQQDKLILNKLHRLYDTLKSKRKNSVAPTKIKILIRKRNEQDIIQLPRPFQAIEKYLESYKD